MISLGVLGIAVNIYLDFWRNLIWLCNHMSIILGIAFLGRNRFWITAEMNLAMIPQLIWSIDFIGALLTGTFVFNSTQYMFSPEYNPFLYFLSLNHLFITPIALFGLYRLGGAVNALSGSAIHGIILWAASHLFVKDMNLNCLITPCIPIAPEPYFLTLPILYAIMMVVTNRLLLWGFKKIKK